MGNAAFAIVAACASICGKPGWQDDRITVVECPHYNPDRGEAEYDLMRRFLDKRGIAGEKGVVALSSFKRLWVQRLTIWEEYHDEK